MAAWRKSEATQRPSERASVTGIETLSLLTSYGLPPQPTGSFGKILSSVSGKSRTRTPVAL